MLVKKKHVLMIFLCVEGAYTYAYNKPKLVCSTIKLFDNKSYGLDPFALGNMVKVRRELRKVLYGVPDPNNKQHFVGFYFFQGQMRTFRWLVHYEEELEREFLENTRALLQNHGDYEAYSGEWELAKINLENEYEEKHMAACHQVKRTISDAEECDYEVTKLKREHVRKLADLLDQEEERVKRKYIFKREDYDRALQRLVQEHQENLAALKPCLEKAKEDVLKANEVFSATSGGPKKLLLKIVAEFCVKFQRPATFLLEWTEVQEGQEYVLFEKNMVTCKALMEFIVDTVDFLETLYYSCEKARAAFEAQQKK